MGKKSRKGQTRAGVKQHPGSGQSKARTKSTSGGSCAGSIMSQDSVSIASSDLLKSTLASAPMANGMGPPPLDVLNFVNTLMMQQQLQQQAEAAARAAADQSPCNKENASATEEESAKLEARSPMVVTLDESLDEATMAALIVEKIGQVTRGTVPPAENATESERVADVEVSLEPERVHATLDSAREAEVHAVDVDAFVLEEKASADDVDAIAASVATVTDMAPSTTDANEKVKDVATKSVREVEADAVEAEALVLEEKASSDDVEAVAAEQVIASEQKSAVVPDLAANDVVPTTGSSEAAIEKATSAETQSTEQTGVSASDVASEVTEALANDEPANAANDTLEENLDEAANKPDVWSSNLREIVDSTSRNQPVLDVTPIKKPMPSVGKIDTFSEEIDTPGLNLHTPSPRDVDAAKNDCGCIIV